MADENQYKIDEMIVAFNKLGSKADEVIDNFLEEGAKILESAAKQKVYQVLKRRTGNLQANIKTGEIWENKKGKFIVVGPAKGDNSVAYYGKFSEYGTSRQKATPWLRPAMIENEAKIEKLFHDKIDKAIKEWGD